MLTELKELFHSSFSKISSSKDNVGLVLMTHDAHVIQTIETLSNSSEAALVSGLWEASHQLTNNRDSILDFSTNSSEGFFVGCLDQEGKYIVYSKYSKQMNPAHLKFLFKQSICEFKEGTIKIAPTQKAEFLFDSISDEEIESMFMELGV